MELKRTRAAAHRPAFLAFPAGGDLGLLWPGEDGPLVVRGILGGLWRATTAVDLGLSGSTSATRRALFCCSSCDPPPEGDTGRV